MSDFYKILKADPLGEPWTPNEPGAKAIQNYWCQVEGQEKAVSIGKQVRDDGQPALSPGQHVYGDLMYAKSQKGTEYWKFKSAKVPEGVVRPAESPAQVAAQQATGSQPTNMSGEMPDWFKPVANQIDYIARELRKMDADAPAAEVEALIKADEKELEVVGEPVDKETEDFLRDLFDNPPADEEVKGDE